MNEHYKESDIIREEIRKKGYDVRTVRIGTDGKGRKDILVPMLGAKWVDGKWVGK